MPKEKGITLKPIKFDAAVKALLQTPPMARSRKIKKMAEKLDHPGRSRR
jgi:hypothetical protein